MVGVALIRARLGLPYPVAQKGNWPCSNDSVFFRFLGVAYMIVGAAQAGVAVGWGFWWGFGNGILAIAVGASLILPQVWKACKGRAHAGVFSFLEQEHEHGSDDSNRGGGVDGSGGGTMSKYLVLKGKAKDAFTGSAAMTAIRVFLVGYFLYVLLLCLIRAGSPDPTIGAFPNACAEDKISGCTRVATAEPNRNAGAAPLVVAASFGDVTDRVESWVESHPRGRVLGVVEREDGVLLHARFVSPFWGFADDHVVSISCAGGEAKVEAQAWLRLGKSDMGVNRRRVMDMLAVLAARDPYPVAQSCQVGRTG